MKAEKALAAPRRTLGFSVVNIAGFRYAKTIHDNIPVVEPAIIPGGSHPIVEGTVAAPVTPMLDCVAESAGLGEGEQA